MSVPARPEPPGAEVPAWGRRLTVPCPACGLATHRHRTLDYDGVSTYRSQAGPDPAHVIAGEEPEVEAAWIALIPGDFPATFFADTEVYHLADGIAWPGPHHRDYGTAHIAHDACCPVLHATQPVTSRGAGELWRAMRLRLARHSHQRP
ncbi:DUF6083 domain-containing protein [Streptomyces sp. NPDC007904]|uniref:DUF6083 domain-containing protein n=1 Tax=Streptomyces sp. NPDC007904 TaxID=3364787 RepID=UPI0036EA8141